MTGPTTVARRTVLAAAGAAAGALALSACSSDTDTDTGTGTGTGSQAGSDPTPPPTAGDGRRTAASLVRLDDVPVGGAVSAEDPDGRPILVAQPQPGTAVAFSAICTHMGCTVAPADRELACPCHGSVYDPASGEVLRGPAPRALDEVEVHVEDGAVLPGPAGDT